MRFPLIMALILGAPSAGAQAAQQSFTIRRGADTIAIENFSRDGGILTGDITQKNGTRIEYVAVLRPDKSVEHVDMTRKAQGGSGALSIDLDEKQIQVAFTQGGTSEKASFAPGARPAPFLAVSFALSEQMIKAAGLKPGQSVKWLALRLGAGDTATVTISRFHADSVSITMADVGLKVRVNSANDVVGGTHNTQPWIVERKP
jgi:hypothetical protein